MQCRNPHSGRTAIQEQEPSPSASRWNDRGSGHEHARGVLYAARVLDEIEQSGRVGGFIASGADIDAPPLNLEWLQPSITPTLPLADSLGPSGETCRSGT